jgi:hypothetical protein
MMQESTRELITSLNNPNLDAGIMQPILNTDDNETPDSMATKTPSFLASVDELLDAGYRSTTGNLLNWTNGTQRATIEICVATGGYGVVYYPTVEPASKPDKAEELYAYLLRMEAEVNRANETNARLRRELTSIHHDICTLQNSAYSTAGALKAHATRLDLVFNIAHKLKRTKHYAELALGFAGGLGVINLIFHIIR